MSAVLYEKELKKGILRGRSGLQFCDTSTGLTRPDVGKYSIVATEMVKLWPVLINHVQFCNKR
jgi:hypothetical protein